MPKAYSYRRFSRPEQSKGDSLRRQSEKALKYAEAHGLHLDESLTISDLGVSAFRGANADTGALGEFIQAINTGRVEQGSYLLVESLDRISRDHAYDAQFLLGQIINQGITIVTLADEREYSLEILRREPFRLIEATLIMIRSHEESATKSGRLKEAWANKRQSMANKPMTSIVPAWLHVDRKSNNIEVIEDRAKIVQRIYHDYLRGAGQASIAIALNREGVPTWGRSSMWRKSYITKILNNPAVYGVAIPHRMEHEGPKKKRVPAGEIQDYFPVVIPKETFLQAQAMQGKAGTKGRKTAPVSNIFGYIGKCPACGMTMLRVNKGKKWQYLACSSAKNGAGCNYRSVPYDALEDTFLKAVRGGLELPIDTEKLELLRSKKEEATARMERHIQERSHLVEAIKSGVIKEEAVILNDVPTMTLVGKIDEGAAYAEEKTPWTLRNEIQLLDNAVEASRKEIAAINGQLAILRPDAVKAKLQELTAAAREAEIDRARVNAGLRALCKRAVIRYDDDTVELQFHHTDQVLCVPADMGARQ